MLFRRAEQLFEQLYAQKDYDFMTCWKEIDSTSTGYLSEKNIQTFFKNIGVNHPQIHQWLFRRFSPYSKEKLDINDFRRIFDYMGNGILGNSQEGSLQSSEIENSKKKRRQGTNQLPTQDKLTEAMKKRKSSIRSAKAEYQKRLSAHPYFSQPSHPKDTHKQKVFNMRLEQGLVKISNDESSKHGITLKSGKYISIAEQKIHSDFVNKNKRKKVLLKQFLHDSKLLTNNHNAKKFYYEIELLKTVIKITELQRELTSSKFDLCLREDFNVLNLFKHFDKKNMELLGLPDFENGLAEFGLFPHRSDICLVMRSQDKQTKARLDFDDFSAMIIPRDEEFRNMMIERIKLDSVEKRSYLSTIGEDTFNALTRFFNQLVTFCVSAEALRQRLISDVGIDLHQAFAHLPKAHKQLLSAIDLDRLYKSRNITATYRDIAEFIKEHDLDCDGKLSYIEFSRSLTPIMTVSYI